MSERLKKIFEREYRRKGFTKREADSFFYGFMANRGIHYLRKVKGGRK